MYYVLFILEIAKHHYMSLMQINKNIDFRHNACTHIHILVSSQSK